MLLGILLLAHLIADFYFQTKKIADLKKEKFSVLLLHCGIYAITFAVVNFVFVNAKTAILATFIIAVFHFVFDYVKIKFDEKYMNYAHHFCSFVLDQILHLSVIFVTYKLLNLAENTTKVFSKCIAFSNFEKIMILALLFAFLLQPVGVFIYKLLPFLCKEEYKTPHSEMFKDDKKKEQKEGDLIGQLERMIIAILLLCNQYSAIGLVFTAKSIARSKKLEDKSFAEKYLIGTLVSLLIVLVTTILVKYFVPQITLVMY